MYLDCISFIGAGIGYLTQDSINTWYQRTSLASPRHYFQYCLEHYTMIAIAGWTIWQHIKNMTRIKQLFVPQLLLNWSWNPIFSFPSHGSLLCIILI